MRIRKGKKEQTNKNGKIALKTIFQIFFGGRNKTQFSSKLLFKMIEWIANKCSVVVDRQSRVACSSFAWSKRINHTALSVRQKRATANRTYKKKPLFFILLLFLLLTWRSYVCICGALGSFSFFCLLFVQKELSKMHNFQCCARARGGALFEKLHKCTLVCNLNWYVSNTVEQRMKKTHHFFSFLFFWQRRKRKYCGI